MSLAPDYRRVHREKFKGRYNSSLTVLKASKSPIVQYEVVMTKLPEGAPSLDEILIQSENVGWREKSLKGIHEKMLWRNDETGASIALIKFDKGAGIPQPHLHAANQFMFCLKGKYEYTSTGKATCTVRRSRTKRQSSWKCMTGPTTRKSHPGTRTNGMPIKM